MNRKRGRWRVQLLLCSECPQALLQAHQAGCTEIASLLCPILPPSTPMSAQALPDPWRPREGRPCRAVARSPRAGALDIGQASVLGVLAVSAESPPPVLPVWGWGELGLILSAFALLLGLQATRGTAKALIQEEQRQGASGRGLRAAPAPWSSRVGWLPAWSHSSRAWLSGPLGTLRATKIDPCYPDTQACPS